MDSYSYLKLSWLPFHGIKFMLFFIFISISFIILFIFVLKKLLKDKEQKEMDLFFDTLDIFALDSEQKRIVKIFAVAKMKYNRYRSFLWYAVENTLSIEDKEYVKSFEIERLLPSDKFKEFLHQHDEEYKIYKKIDGKISRKIFKDNFLVICIMLILLMLIFSIFSVFLYYFY